MSGDDCRSPGTVAYYIHKALTPTTGSVASAVVLEGGGSDSSHCDAMVNNGKRLAMQVSPQLVASYVLYQP